MHILWSFSYNSFVKFLGKKFGSHNMTMLYPSPCYTTTRCVRPNKKISVFWVTGLKILGRVGTHIFFNHFLFWKKYNFMHFERHFAFQDA